MADLTRYYTPEAAPEADDFSPIPPGWYDAEIVDIEERDTRAGDGCYLNVRFDVTGPTNAGRVIFEMYTMENPSPKAVRAGHAKFRQLHEACGLPHITDTDQLVGRSCAIKVKIERNEQYGDKNRVQASRAQSGGSAPRGGAAPASVAPPKRAAGSPPPAGLPPRPAAGPPAGAPAPAGPPAPAPIEDNEPPF